MTAAPGHSEPSDRSEPSDTSDRSGRPGPGRPGGGQGGDAGMTWRQLVGGATRRLAGRGVDNAAQEARWVAEQAGGLDAAGLVLALDHPAPSGAAAAFAALVERRASGEPLQYVLGSWPFRGLELAVDRRVLIPRPETEVLADHALGECDRLGAKVAVDLGTGSGALALALLAERDGLEVWATDVSRDALDVAGANLAALGPSASRGHLAEGEWFAALPDDLRGRVDVVVTNPPYVADGEAVDLPDDVIGWEPHRALFSGPTGLEDIEAILAEAPAWLSRPGAVVVELAPHQATPAARLARRLGYTAVSAWPDLTGRDRILTVRT